MKDKIKNILLSLGADTCGVANIDRFTNAPEGFSPSDIFKNCKSVIAFGVALPKGLLEVSPRLIYEHYNSVTKMQMDNIALKAAKIIEKDFATIAVPMPCDSPYDYWQQDTLIGKGLISMRHIAEQSGIGRIGKNSLLLNAQFGNMLTLGAVLTDMALQSDEICESICIDGCSRCLNACPASAIENKTVNQRLCRLNTYGKNDRGYDTVECNKCRASCPMRYGKIK